MNQQRTRVKGSTLKDPLLQLFPMQQSDVAEVAQLEFNCYEFPWTKEIFLDCLSVGYCCWVYRLDVRLVGYGIMSVAVGEAHILNICVEPELRGQGLGRRLLERLLNLARKHHADTAFLEVRESNRAAQSLYQSVGFNEVGLRRGYYPAGKGRENAIVLALNL
ncbi:MAG: ribosomal protein S18-alanine N-acetyltransferase [Chromatiaceae bacterium]|nr:ribosomal protein S18-alanine N-acetyltransferase [Gammaproteobacteria bacterium]MCB1860890.1 ribosomal protein S18-alanine N-acetyltransferase [Gammaproteobacteria bacterium]MCB1872544.1 ribosomal protein S18-alanine N-acetyltransferase [Gammaproteobacteria bacterium]MCB1878592.1 ribosomal protein S18-alanine N-acetyltransferase [Gammaproteobacteria bacterium]MCP5448636.1 ribosomal protein S18-alanine N-acetyltransferase [Chromatiaceae bacterium]